MQLSGSAGGPARRTWRAATCIQTLAEATTLLRTTSDAVQAADLPGLTADIRKTSAALRDTLQGEQMQKLLANAGLAADRLATAGGAAAAR